MVILLIRLFTLLRLVLTGLVLTLSGVGLAVFLTYYGISRGIVNKKLRIFRLMSIEVTGKEAERYGWFYVVTGMIVLAISIRIITTHYNWILRLFR
ncbi:MAG: hypothetical protein HY200_03075 [Nitrospirae bacterium]|nr:hypothetical protein [Nitrospirota bacterium]MBI3593915.1 hypothetical protein [Nitrospirota bacterium]